MKITIVGGMGYVGTAFFPLLDINQIDLTVIDPNWFDTSLQNYNVSYIRQDIRNVKKLPEGDILIYLAAISNDPMGIEFASQTYQINENEAIRTAYLAKSNGYKKYIFASSCSVYGGANTKPRHELDVVDPLTDYAKSKINSEIRLEEIAETDFQIVCLRFATACGVSLNTRLDLALNDFVITAITENKITILSDGTPWRPFINVNDMAKIMLMFCNSKHSLDFEIYNVGSSKFTYQMKDLAKHVASTLGCSYEIVGKLNKDSRSYRVDFTKLEKKFGKTLKLKSLEETIMELKNMCLVSKRKHGDNYFENFRNNPNFIRLEMLRKKQYNGIFDDNLFEK